MSSRRNFIEEPRLTDAEIEAILAEDNAQMPEHGAPAPQPVLVESPGAAATWVKWLLLCALFAEVALGLLR